MSDETLQRLQIPLDSLSAMGLERPTDWTVRQHLRFLAAEQLLDGETVEAYLECYQRTRFGGGASAGHSGAVLEALTGEIDALSQLEAGELDEIIERMARPPVPDATIPTPVQARNPRADYPDEALLDPPETGDEESSDTPRKNPRWTNPWIVTAAFLLWTPLVLIAGYRWADPIGNILATYRGEEAVSASWDNNVRQQLTAARDQAAADPQNAVLWTQYALFALRHGRTSDAIVAYRHVVSLEPNNAEALNNLAWLMLTADDHFVRDPIQGLELAERAYAIEASPHITDTLAEAAYQNGDYARAVTLEEDALSRVERGRSFYEVQLEKFRLAAGGTGLEGRPDEGAE